VPPKFFQVLCGNDFSRRKKAFKLREAFWCLLIGISGLAYCLIVAFGMDLVTRDK
jgi:hypothetical protein